jgi:outer membrane biosynthesis protein TonB
MNAESVRVTRTEVWTDWEGHVINRVFPLVRFLGSSSHSAVFLTEHKAQNSRQAAIKFVPADDVHTEAQRLVQWGSAAALSHAHLVRLFDMGRCQFGGRTFVFAVMEYSEQTLAEILPKRALTLDEVRQMLPPILQGLSQLHANNLIHGQLKPANIVVVNDVLKLTTDTARAATLAPGSASRNSLYDPPELSTQGSSTAGDIWALGITLVESLTQRYPVPGERSQTPLLPAGVPAEFTDTVRRCLSRVPAHRPTVADLEALCQLDATPTEVTAVLEPAQVGDLQATPREESPKGRMLVTTVAVVLLLAIAAWLAWRYFQADVNSELVQPAAAQGLREGSPVANFIASTPVTPGSAGSDRVGESGAAEAESGSRAGPDGSAGAPPTGAEATSGGHFLGPDESTGAPARNAIAATEPPSRNADATTGLPARNADAMTDAPSRGTDADHTTNSPLPGAAGSAASRESAQALAEPAPTAASPSADDHVALMTTSSPSAGVVYEALPNVPTAILSRIHGHVVVKVRVLLDPAGTVVGQFLESSGPSRYFAHASQDAAGKWRFAPREGRGSRVSQLRFEFTRAGATAQATPAQ